MIKLALSLLGTFFLTMHSYANFCYTSPDTEQSIVILTIPKSGTHLLHKALGLITGEEIRAEEPQIINGKSVYFSHLWPENESVINDPNCLKIIFFSGSKGYNNISNVLGSKNKKLRRKASS